MCAAATSDYFVISDSDVRVQPNYLREIMSAIVQPGVGMVTCLYRGVPTGGLWARLEALGMSVEMTSGVLVADMLEGMRFALGPTMAIRREVLDAVGGMAGLAEYCADDYLLGQRAFAAGWQVVLSHHVIDHVVVSRDFRSSVLHQVRWMKSTRFSRGLAHIGTGLTFAMPYGLLGCAAGLWMKRPALAGVMLGIAVLNRFLLALVSGWNVVRDRRVLRDFWLYPLRDLMGFAFWCASFFGNTIHWRGERYTLHRGGRMRRIAVPDSSAPESKPVAVDRLA
jgi:ceramide glucosyltransferase